jgi:diguanylate cyclase (GGDEF)-like protein
VTTPTAAPAERSISSIAEPRGSRPAWHATPLVPVAAALLTFVLPTAALALTGSDASPLVPTMVSLTHSALALFAGATILSPARRMKKAGRRAWSAIGTGTILWGLSNAGMAVSGVFGADSDTRPGWIATFIVANTILVAGVVALPASSGRAGIRRLDTAIMMVAATGILWVLPVARVLDQIAGRRDALLYGTLSIVKVVSVLLAVGAIARCRPDARNEIRPFTSAVIALGVADLVLASSSQSGYPLMTRAVDGIYTLAMLLLVVTGKRLTGPPVAAGSNRTGRRYRLATPELTTVVGLTVLALHGQLSNGSAAPTLLLGGTLVVLAIWRLGQLEQEQRLLAASLRDSAERLHHQARVDSLTGLGNRLALDERLATTVADRRADDQGIAVFFIDIDHFKRFNDGLGHHVGDQLLTEIAGRLSDVLGDGVHRVGGDEFVAFRDRVGLRAAQLLASDVVSIARAPVDIDGIELNCAVSVGLAHDMPGSADGAEACAETLLRRADLALYDAKERGRDQWAVYDPRLQQRADQRLSLQQSLHRGIERDEITVHYRPVVELSTRRVVGLSATPVWDSHDHGVLGPETFMSAARDGGLLPHLATLLFQRIGDTIREVERGSLPVRWISTALSREQIVHPGLVDLAAEALRCSDASAQRLRVEVSEDTVVDLVALKVLQQLKELGIHLGVHRFGTGASSLLSLGRYPASTITVDESFVEGLGRRTDDTVIVTAVAGMTADLGLELAADGVSEEFQARMLSDLGCTLARGRLFGESTPLEDQVGAMASAVQR